MEASVPGRNGGRLLPGGKPGNRGGKGAIPSRVRAMCREGFAAAVPVLCELAQGKGTEGNSDPTPGEIVRAIDALGKYGLGAVQAVQVEDAEIAKTAVRLVHEMFGADRVEEFADRLATEIYNGQADELDDESDD